MNLIKIGGEAFIIDLKAMDDIIASHEDLNRPLIGEEIELKYTYENPDTNNEKLISKEKIVRQYDKGKEIDVSKYETLKMLIDIVMSYNEEIDDTLGMNRVMMQMPIPFKIAFNTLLYYQVLKKIEI